ncbi:MAG: peptidoglycan DD-metalloendopeptidase family protein [Oscillospiraceae bacterium]|nr:peptidoglycan DD-metalloendopeptidase family protein [Oscillospiraceae bacterium]
MTKPYLGKRIALFLALLMLVSVLFTAFGSISASAASNSEIDRLEQEKQSIQNNKNEVGKKLAELREEKAAWIDQKTALDEKNRLAQEEILNTQKQIEIYTEMIAEKQAEADAAQAAADETLEKYKVRLRALEENGKMNTYFAVLSGASDFSEVLSRVDMMTEIMDHDKRIEQEYKDARDFALTAKAEYEQMNLELEAKKTELEQQVIELEAEIEETNQIIAELQKEIDQYEAIYNAALQREYAVQNSINSIIAQLKAAGEAAKQPDSAPSDGTVAPPDTSTVTGSYIWPLPSGRLVTSLFGNRVHPEYGTVKFHKGIDINASVGAPIVAADGGTVVTVGNDPAGYGIYVAIYHSGGRSTLYAHMNAAAVSTGQTVSQGQVIGYAGSSGVSTGPHLHFEIAVDGALHNPLGYFSGYSVYSGA